MKPSNVIDELISLDREINYAGYEFLPVICDGGIQIKILDYQGRVCTVTHVRPTQAHAEIDAKQIVKKLVQSRPEKEHKPMPNIKKKNDVEPNPLLDEILALPKFADPPLAEGEYTLRSMSRELEEYTGIPWSVSKTKNRLEQLVIQGKMKRTKRRNKLVYTLVE